MTTSLLASDEPAAVSVYNEQARSRFAIVCDHANHRIPRALGDMGLTEDDRAAHIAWDIGAAEVARRLADKLDAVLFVQNYSRLVIDCNRPLAARDSIPEVTGGISVPGNQGLSVDDRQTRVNEIFVPYHDRIRGELARRTEPYIFLSTHSFTPILYGVQRVFHAGVLYHADKRLAAPFLEQLRAEPGLMVGDNEPYSASPLTDYSIIEHAQKKGIPYVEIEVRQDLIAEADGQAEWAERLARCLEKSAALAGF